MDLTMIARRIEAELVINAMDLWPEGEESGEESVAMKRWRDGMKKVRWAVAVGKRFMGYVERDD